MIVTSRKVDAKRFAVKTELETSGIQSAGAGWSAVEGYHISLSLGYGKDEMRSYSMRLSMEEAEVMVERLQYQLNSLKELKAKRELTAPK